MHRLTRVTLRNPAAAALTLLAITAFMAVGATKVRTEFGSRVLIGDDHPAIQRLDRLLDQFGGGVPLYIAWECGEGRPCESVFDPVALEMANSLVQDLAPTEGVSKIYSPTNSPLFVPLSDGFAVRRFVESGKIVEDHVALAELALRDPTWTGNLISDDGLVGAIIIQTNASKSGVDEVLVDAILEALEPHSEYDFKLVGEAFGNIIGGRELSDSTARLIPVMVLVIALVIFAQTRSWQSTIITLLTMGTALLWTFGTLGWLDWPQDSILQTLAPLIVIIGVCDAIHFLTEYAAVRGSEKPDSVAHESFIADAAKRVSTPCMLTTLTTCLAFASFATSDLGTFERFGWISAYGALACLITTFSLLPLLTSRLPSSGPKSWATTEAWDRALKRISNAIRRRSQPILTTTAVLMIGCSFGWAEYLRIDMSREELFGKNSRVFEWIRFFEENIRPSSTIEVAIELPKGSTVEHPETISAIEAFTARLVEHPATGSTWSITDPANRLSLVLYGDSPSPARTRNSFAEVIELLGFEDAELVTSWVTPDRNSLRVSIDVPEQNFVTAVQLMKDVRIAFQESFAGGSKIELTGTLPLAVDWVTAVQSTQLRSFPTAFALILVVLSLYFRSITLGLIALIPAVLPVVTILGIMGFAGMSLDVGRAMLGAIVIGIAVDDSIHLLFRYRKERGAGLTPADAIQEAVVKVGRPIITTSIALALGFLTLTLSAWGTISSFGFFVSIAMLAALASALIVLPALIVTVAGGHR